jgi:hypothetical protein
MPVAVLQAAKSSVSFPPAANASIFRPSREIISWQSVPGFIRTLCFPRRFRPRVRGRAVKKAVCDDPTQHGQRTRYGDQADAVRRRVRR